jgi:hypothetical protein
MACLFFGACCCLLFLCSWLYHRVRWSPRWEVLMQKLDHCSIFLMVTGTRVLVALGGGHHTSTNPILTTPSHRTDITLGNVAPLSLLALRRTRLVVLTGSCLVAAWGMVQIFR